MKKHFFLILTLFCLGIGTTRAQYTVLHKFNDTTGANNNLTSGWSGSLYSDGTYLYGMTTLGGPNIGPSGCGSLGFGVIFKIKPDGSGYDTLASFNGTTGGCPLFSSLISDGTYLYGMASAGAPSSVCCGSVFKIKPDGSGFDTLVTFNAYNGCSPMGSLVYDGTYLYGMTNLGDGVGQGSLFKIKTDGSGFVDMLSLVGSTGDSPYGSLILKGNYLYGMTETAGGTSTAEFGTIFKVKTDNTGFNILHVFNDTNGAYPYGSLLLDGNYFYGMTEGGGAFNEGVIFKIKTDGSGFDTLFSFNNNDGSSPYGTLISIGRNLYGMTSAGGTTYGGTIFKIDTNGTHYSVLYNFNNNDDINGINPYGALLFDGTYLYGMTASGGEDNFGVIFKIDTNTTTSIKELPAIPGTINIYPNPASDEIKVISEQSTVISIEIYILLGEDVYSLPFNDNRSPFTLNIADLPSGVYVVEVKTKKGLEVQKFVKE
jgi:uncharacterized repeat protein (TIGR03803 family)